MKEQKQRNSHRSRLFGIVINPRTLDQKIDWNSKTNTEIKEILDELKFPNKFDLKEFLNSVKFDNVNNNTTEIEDFEGQLELGTNSNIPHYQIALKTKTLTTKSKILEVLENNLNAMISVDTQHDFNSMTKYCLKETPSISEEYSGRIYKHEWKQNFIDLKPELKLVLEEPYPWQKFFVEQILSKEPSGRVVDWLIDPDGNTGKSTFARAYISKEPTDGIFMKIDNLDRMELALIQKIKNYRDRYGKNPRIIFFDFPRAVDMKQVVSATALMEDAKSGYLETTFGGKHKELRISNVHVVVLSNNAPDLSVLSVDRWRLWRLGGSKFNNIVWPCTLTPIIKKFHTKSNSIEWTVILRNKVHHEIDKLAAFKDIKINEEWFLTKAFDDQTKIFGVTDQFTKDIVSSMNDSPNYIKRKALKWLSDNNDPSLIINKNN